MDRQLDPRANPILGSDVISGQITDKALALFNLLNQVTGSEGDNLRNFDIEGAEPLTLALYTLEPDENSHAWSPRERIYFQDNGQKLRDLQSKLRTNFDRIEDNITDNINTLFTLISESESDLDGDGVSDGGVVAGDAEKSILDEIDAIANDSEKTNEDLENAIEELVTGEEAINRLVDALFENFNLNVQRLDDEIFDLLDDNDDIFSNSASGTDSTEIAQYLLDFNNGEPTFITLNREKFAEEYGEDTPYVEPLDQALERTLSFLESEHEGDEPWNEETAVSNYVLAKFFQGELLLDQGPDQTINQGLIGAIINDANYFSQDPETQEEELAAIRSQRDFLSKFESSRDFLDFAIEFYSRHDPTNPIDDQAVYRELFKHDLAARTPKYYEDNRSLADMLRGKMNSANGSSSDYIFGGLKDKITQAADGAVQALSGGFDKLASNNFEAFVRANPILLIENLIAEREISTDDERLETIDEEIEALETFQRRQLDSFVTWFKEKNKALNKTKKTIEELEEIKLENPERSAEINEEINSLYTELKNNDGGLTQSKLRSRAELAITALQAILDDPKTTEPDKIAAINEDIILIQNTLLTGPEADIDIDEAIYNGAAIAVNKAIASELNRADPGDVDSIKDLYQRYDFLELGDLSEITLNPELLSETIGTVVKSPNAHISLYATELLESGKINARFYNRKLPEVNKDGTLPEDNQLAPPQISPTPISAAIAAIGNQILSKANNLLYETSLPDETWIDDNAEILNEINTEIIADPSLSSAGAVFFKQLREGFKTTIRDFFNTHSSSKERIDDAKATYEYIKNLRKDSEIDGTATEAMDEIEAALDWLGTDNAELATDRIFVNPRLSKSIKKLKRFITRGNLDFSDDEFTNQLNFNSFKSQLEAIYDPNNLLHLSVAASDPGDDPINLVDRLESYIGTDVDESTWNDLVDEIKDELQAAHDLAKDNPANEYLKKTDLGSIKTRLENIIDGTDPDISELTIDRDSIDTNIDSLSIERSNKAFVRDILIAMQSSGSAVLEDIATAIAEILDIDDFDDGSGDTEDILSNIISHLNNRINFINGSDSGSISDLESQRSDIDDEISALTTRATRLLGESDGDFGIDDIIDHLEIKKTEIETIIAEADPPIPGGNFEAQLRNYRKQLNNDYTSDLISSDSLEAIETQLESTLRSTDLDLDANANNDFVDLDNVINGIGGLADQVTAVFGDNYDKGQILGQLEKAVVTKQVLQAELAQTIRDELSRPDLSPERSAELSTMLTGLEAEIEDLDDLNDDLVVNRTNVLREVLDPSFINATSSPEKIDEISKILYGFETVALETGGEEIIIGSADDIKERSLINGIEDLKVDAGNILEQDLPEDETDLVNLLHESKNDHIGFERQSIKRLILLMFVLSMLEYSDWDYRKQESDPSRYAVF